ncbi:hypothetical protein DUI87_18770 [Hirundo rustica rustica]|uniref:Leucine-rich repeat flightless-interacting protein 2 n=1 Tax=Hirundo rustica rustica TaxID=333673 RepID=A0A3M0JX73_HIRRU|nr:hypothetical protein DUI87_18770 [Hirundo rustica rustica]
MGYHSGPSGQSWANETQLKFNKSKYNILHVSQGNLRCRSQTCSKTGSSSRGKRYTYERAGATAKRANLARNTTVPFDVQKDLLLELWQNPEMALHNKNLPIRLAIQPDKSFQPCSKIKQLPSEPLVTFVERLTRAIELQVKNEGAQEQVLEERALADADEQCKAAILSLSIEPAPTLYDTLQLEEKSEKSHSEIFSRPSSRNSVSAASLSGNSSRRGSGDASSLVDPDASLSELRDIYDLKDQIHDVEWRYMQGLKELKEAVVSRGQTSLREKYATAKSRIDSLAEVEEKYKKAMVSNAQLDNEKNNLIYQVDTLKDVIEEKEEQIAEFCRENEEKSKANQRMQENIDSITKEVFDLQETINWKDKKIGALERQKDYFDGIKNERDELREELADLKETVKRGEKHGLVIIPDGTPNGDVNHESVVGTITVVSQEAAQVLESAGEGPLDIRLRKLAGEKEELLSQVRKLKMQLEEERQKYSKNDGMNPDIIGLENGSDLQLIEMQRDANRQISEYKFKLSKAEQDITTLEQNIGRLEGQVARYKNAAENAEKVEDELKAEKRKLQREGFVDSPHLFGQALEQLLSQFVPIRGTKLLQYVDDLLVVGPKEEEVRESTIALLNFLGNKGLKVSKSKLQFTECEVKYLGHWISKGKKKLDPERVASIIALSSPQTKREIRQVLGLLGYCRQWIEGYSEKVKFLYEKLTTDRLKWTEQDKQGFKILKETLVTTPVLSLPDVKREFQLIVDVSSHTAYGVLTQDGAGNKKPVRYLSKLLAPVSKGWPTCLQAIVAVALLVEEAKKVTFGAPLVVYTPHNVRNILQQNADKWLTDARLLKYEAILIHSPGMELRTTTAQSPAQFLFGETLEKPAHSSAEIIELQTKMRPDLEKEFEDGEKWFVDGSAGVVEGKRKSGYAIVDGGYRPKGLCTKCFEKEEETIRLLVLATQAGLLKLDSPEWYLLYKKGIRRKLDAKAEVLTIDAGGPIRYPAELTPSSYQCGTFLRGGLRFRPALGPLKNTPAAKKMVYLAAGCYPAGEGRDRGVHQWGNLMVLSLVMCQAGGLHRKNPLRQNPTNECEQCLKGKIATKVIKFQAQYNCQLGKENGYCVFNSTQYNLCKLEKGVICHNPKAISRDGQSEPIFKRKKASSHAMYKWETGQMPTIPICSQYNGTVWLGGKIKSTFVAYYQVSKLCYEKGQLEMCSMGRKMYWVGKNLKREKETSLDNEPIILDLFRSDDDRICLHFDKTFCFSKNEEGLDPESKMELIAQELKRQESEGMQIAALPTDPELVVGKTGQNPKMSKIMKLEEKKEANKAAEALEKIERRIKKENAVHQKYCEISQGEWDDYSKLEDSLSSF